MQAIDTLLFYKINSWASLQITLDSFFVFVSLNFYWLIWLLFILLLVISVDDVSLGKKIKRIIKRTSELRKLDYKLFTAVVASSVVSYFVSQLIGRLVGRSRPFIELNDVAKLIADPISTKSFPSDHTVLSFAIAFSVFYHHKKWGTLFIIMAALVGFSRVYVGVHYPLDVLAGVLLAWLISYIIYKVISR